VVTTGSPRLARRAGPTLIVDDGGDATLFVHKAAEFEESRQVPPSDPSSDPENGRHPRDDWRGGCARIRGCGRVARGHSWGVEETTTASIVCADDVGWHALVSGHQRQRFGDQEQIRQASTAAATHCPTDFARATDVMLGRQACRSSLRRGRQGCAQALRGQGARVVVRDHDPICALQAAMEGYEVVTIDDVVEKADIFITATGNFNIIGRTPWRE
jgi:adenosylhomocysteinase